MIAGLQRILGGPHQFKGGIFLPAWGASLRAGTVEALPLPEVLNVPLLQHDGLAALPEVSPGQCVETGQRIGRAQQPRAVDVHAPAAGTVLEVATAWTAVAGEVAAVRIRTSNGEAENRKAPDNPDTVHGFAEALPRDMAAPGMDDLVRSASTAGLTDLQPHARSLADLLGRAAGSSVGLLIINCLPGEPLGGAEFVSDPQRNDALVRMSTWIGAALSAQRTCIAVDRADGQLLKQLRSATRGAAVRVVGLINKYPQHTPKLLAYALAGVETPPGVDTSDLGLLVLQAEAVLNLAMTLGTPHGDAWSWTHRTITVAGPPVVRPGRYRVPFGTSFADILRHVGLRHTPRRIVDGGPITGRAVPHIDVVTTKQTSAILVLDPSADRIATPGPCVRCGWCQEDCPVGLDPQMLLSFAERGDAQGAQRYYPQACLECGVCSYVCPAELPLAAGAAMLKRELER